MGLRKKNNQKIRRRVRRLNKWTGILACVTVITCQTIALSADVLDHPESQRALADFRGKVETVNPGTGQLVLKDESGQVITVQLASDTRILDVRNHNVESTALRPGDALLIYYNTRNLTALQIDLQPTVLQAFLGGTL